MLEEAMFDQPDQAAPNLPTLTLRAFKGKC